MTKIALVTGASRGLGRNTALSIARHGGDVVLTYRSRGDDAHATVAEIVAMGRKAVAFQLDTGHVAGFAAFADQLQSALHKIWQRKTFDHLVNNAGHGIYATIEQTTEAQFDDLVNVNFKGVYFLTQTLLPLIADGGRIVNLSSAVTRICFPGFAPYACVKGAVDVFTRYMAKELGERGIAVNSVAPGAIETDFGGGGARDNADINKLLASTIALGRVGLPDDVGPMIARLLSEDNRWVNAQRIEVSGGQGI